MENAPARSGRIDPGSGNKPHRDRHRPMHAILWGLGALAAFHLMLPFVISQVG